MIASRQRNKFASERYKFISTIRCGIVNSNWRVIGSIVKKSQDLRDDGGWRAEKEVRRKSGERSFY